MEGNLQIPEPYIKYNEDCKETFSEEKISSTNNSELLTNRPQFTQREYLEEIEYYRNSINKQANEY